jgi:signal transduction histidine kinase
LQETSTAATLATAATVLDALLRRTESAIMRRANALRSVESVIDGLAHQIANPLTGASGIAQLLETDIEDQGQRAAVRQIRQELSRAFVVLNDLLGFQRETGAHAGVLDLNVIAEGIVRLRGYAIREQGIALDVETTKTAIPVRIDARGVEHAMLLALRFGEQQSRGSVNRSMSVRVVELGRTEAAVEITDSGPGNLPDTTATYFDLRFRDDNPRAVLNDDPDLGLADSLLRAAGGRLDVRASKSEGTTLSLVLPRATTGAYVTQSQVS